MPQVLIRPMTAADVPAVAALEQTAPDAWTAAQLMEELQAPFARCLVLCRGGEIAAFCTAQAAADEASLNAITVAPACQGQGLGGQLLRALMQRLADEGAAMLYLEVRAGNAPALALYERAGFFRTGRRPRFYRDPTEDAVTMRCPLPAAPAAQPAQNA